MEIAHYLGKITFDFDATEKLVDKEYKDAYISTFQYVLLCARGMMDNVQRIELICKHRLSSALLKEVAHRRRRYVYEILPARFWESLSQLAETLYFFEDYEVNILMKQCAVELTILAVRHPIYFLIERGKHGHMKLVY